MISPSIALAGYAHFESVTGQVEMSLRVASLDYLGTVAARLRKDAVSTQQTEINDILEAVCH